MTFSALLQKNRQQYRQNQDVDNLPFQGLTPLADLLRPYGAWCIHRTLFVSSIGNGLVVILSALLQKKRQQYRQNRLRLDHQSGG